MSGKYFRSPDRYWALGAEMTTVIACLNTALDGNGAVGIHASKRGLRITLNGRPMVHGKTPKELHANFEARVSQAKNEKAL